MEAEKRQKHGELHSFTYRLIKLIDETHKKQVQYHSTDCTRQQYQSHIKKKIVVLYAQIKICAFILHIVLIILYIKLKSSNKNRDVLTFTYAPDQAYSSEEKLVTWLQTRNETMTNVI